MKARLKSLTFAFALLSAASLASAADNAVLQWNAAALAAIKTTAMAPPMATRALAIMHTAMFDAWANYDETAVGTRLGANLRQPSNLRTLDNKTKAMSFAAYRSLVDFFPTQTAAFGTLIYARVVFGLAVAALYKRPERIWRILHSWFQ